MKIFLYLQIAAVVFFVSCDTQTVTFPPEDKGSVIEKAFADGSGTSGNVKNPTTKITFVFKYEMDNLQAEDIYLDANFDFIKGKLTEIDKKTFELAVIPGKSGMIKASIAPYTFTGWSIAAVQVFADYEFTVYFDNDLLQNGIKISKYNSLNEKIVIPEYIIDHPVTFISQNAFREKQLSSAVIPNSVSVIESFAFFRNELASIIIPNSVTQIGNAVFSNNKLASIVISENVTVIASSAFANNFLEHVVIPSGVISLAGFENNKITNITIPGKVEIIGDFAFMNNNISGVFIPGSVKTIRIYAFAYNLIDNIDIPDSVTEVSGFNNNQITEINLPESIVSIGSYAFANNQIKDKIKIPKKTESIGPYAFANNQIKEIVLDSEAKLTLIGEGAFQNNLLESITIPENVSLNANAFTGNQLLEIKIGKDCTLNGIVFGNGFEVFCRANGNKSGTYKRDDTSTNIWKYMD